MYQRKEQNTVSPACYFNCSLPAEISEMRHFSCGIVNEVAISYELKNSLFVTTDCNTSVLKTERCVILGPVTIQCL